MARNKRTLKEWAKIDNSLEVKTTKKSKDNDGNDDNEVDKEYLTCRICSVEINTTLRPHNRIKEHLK
jgi:hypothetical protein